MSTLDLRALLAAFDERGVRFVVIGGVAVAAHGFVRATADLDLVPDSAQDNLGRLVEAVIGLEATLPTAGGRRFEPARDGSAVRRGSNVTLETAFGAVDVVQRVPGVPSFSVLERNAVTADLLGVSVRICSLGDLRTMKRGRDSLQDRADLEHLPES